MWVGGCLGAGEQSPQPLPVPLNPLLPQRLGRAGGRSITDGGDGLLWQEGEDLEPRRNASPLQAWKSSPQTRAAADVGAGRELSPSSPQPYKCFAAGDVEARGTKRVNALPSTPGEDQSPPQLNAAARRWGQEASWLPITSREGLQEGLRGLTWSRSYF